MQNNVFNVTIAATKSHSISPNRNIS